MSDVVNRAARYTTSIPVEKASYGHSSFELGVVVLTRIV